MSSPGTPRPGTPPPGNPADIESSSSESLCDVGEPVLLSLIRSTSYDDECDATKGAIRRPPRVAVLKEQVIMQETQPKDNKAYTEIPLSPIENDSPHPVNGDNQFVTWTGTIKRGQKPGKVVELQLNQEEAQKLKKRVSRAQNDKSGGCPCGLRKGVHIVLFSILCMPFALLASLCYSFYIGTLCWYNIYLYLSEEKTIWHKVSLCPLLILSYPFLIVLSAVGVSLYAAFIQVSWYFSSWLKEFRDFEKGFFGWVCHKLGVSQCAPYEVVILNEEGNDETGTEIEMGHTAV